MKMKIRLTRCRACCLPVAAVYTGTAALATLLPVRIANANLIIDLDAGDLIWCPNCKEILTDIALEEAPCA